MTLRERIRALPPRERQKHLQRYVADRRAKLLEKLPRDEADEIRRLPPGKQAQRLKQYRTRQLFRRTFQDRGEINRLRKLPRKELRKLLAVKGAGDSAALKPDYLSGPTWRRWKALKPYERVRLLQMVRTGGDLRSGRPSQGRERQQRGRAGVEGNESRDQRARPESRRRSAERTQRDARSRRSSAREK